MYQEIKYLNGKIISIKKLADEFGQELFIPLDETNTDYQNFKKQINADEAQLEDADGNLMSAEQAKEFVKELP